MPERDKPRLSELKRALRWLRDQYRARADAAARGPDRTIERRRRAKSGTRSGTGGA